MSNLSKVKGINVVADMAYANKHLANGWVLISVNSVSVNDARGNSNVSTEYVLGWENALPPKYVSQDKDDTAASKYAYQYEDTIDAAIQPNVQRPKHKPISIID